MTQTDEFTALLLQLTDLSGRLEALDRRQAADARQLRDRVTSMTSAAETLKGTVEQQAEVLRSLTGLDQAVADLAGQLAAASDEVQSEGTGYRPAPSPRIWKLTGQARDDALARLRAWVSQVYRPGYGTQAASLAECWEQHPLCVYGLDWLSELWSMLYLRDNRTSVVLAGQAEWQTRLMPALADQMARETARCRNGHRDPATIGGPRTAVPTTSSNWNGGASR